MTTNVSSVVKVVTGLVSVALLVLAAAVVVVLDGVAVASEAAEVEAETQNATNVTGLVILLVCVMRIRSDATSATSSVTLPKIATRNWIQEHATIAAARITFSETVKKLASRCATDAVSLDILLATAQARQNRAHSREVTTGNATLAANLAIFHATALKTIVVHAIGVRAVTIGPATAPSRARTMKRRSATAAASTVTSPSTVPNEINRRAQCSRQVTWLCDVTT